MHFILMDKWLINLTPQIDKNTWDKQHKGKTAVSQKCRFKPYENEQVH